MVELEKVKLGEKYYNWQSASALFFSLIIFNKPIEDEKVEMLQQDSYPRRSWFGRWGRTVPPSNGTSNGTSATTSNRTKSEAMSGKSEAYTKYAQNEKRLERSMSDPGDHPDDYQTISSEYSSGMKKSLNLTSDELKKLNLNYGENEICFWVTTMYQGNLCLD